MKNRVQRPRSEPPPSHRAYGTVTHAFALLAALVCLAGMLTGGALVTGEAEHQNRLMAALWRGAPPEELMAIARRSPTPAGLPAAMFLGEALLTLALRGAMLGIPAALVAAASVWMRRDSREFFWVVAALLSALLAIVAALGGAT